MEYVLARFQYSLIKKLQPIRGTTDESSYIITKSTMRLIHGLIGQRRWKTL